MKQYIYAYYNNLGGFFGIPFINQFEPEKFKDIFFQSMFTADDVSLNTIKENDLYYLGCFDNIEGNFENTKDFILHCSEIVSQVNAKKKESEVSKDA